MTTTIHSSALGQTGYALGSASMTASSATLTLSSSIFGKCSFSASDVGKAVQVTGADTNGADLHTTISSFTSATQVTLASVAGTTVSGQSAFWYPSGTDDTAAIQSAINATTAEDGEIELADAVYVISSTLTTSSAPFFRCLRGNGLDETHVIVSSAAFAGDMLDIKATLKGVRVQNMTFKHRGPPDGGSGTSTTAAITAFQIASNVVTFTATNNFAAGDQVYVSTMSAGTYLNDQVLTVLVTGLSGSQFEATFTHANVSSTVAAGFAHLDENCIAFERANAVELYADFENVQLMRAPGCGLVLPASVVCSFVGCVALQNQGHGFACQNYLAIGSTATRLDTCWANQNYLAGYYLSDCYYSRLDSCASDKNGNNYYITNCNGIALDACGSEAAFSRGGSLLAEHFHVRAGGGVTLDSCYATSANGESPSGTHYSFTNGGLNHAARNCTSVGADRPPAYAFQITSGNANITVHEHYFLDMAGTEWLDSGTNDTVVLAGTRYVNSGQPKIKDAPGNTLTTGQVALALASDFTTTSNAATDTNLAFQAAASEAWLVEFGGTWSSQDANGVNLAVQAPTGASIEGEVWGNGTSTTALRTNRLTGTGLTTANFSATAGTNTDFFGWARVKTSTTTGGITLAGASVTNGQTLTMKAGAWLRATRITEI